MITRFLPSAFQYPFIHIPAQISIFYPIHQSLVVDLSAQLIEEADIQVKPFPVGIRTKRTGYFRLGISTYDFVGRTPILCQIAIQVIEQFLTVHRIDTQRPNRINSRR